MMEETYIDLMLNRGVAGVLIVFIAFLMALLKVVFDMYKQSNTDNHEMSKEVISVIQKCLYHMENTSKNDDKINNKLDEIKHHIYGNNR